MAKQKFYFFSNSLDDLGEFLNLGRKESTGGFSLWRDCMEGDKKAWKKMCSYNIQDVDLLEQVYLHLRPWTKTPLNHAIIRPNVCPVCAAEDTNFVSRGLKMTASGTARRCWECKSCGKCFTSNETIKRSSPEHPGVPKYKQ